MPRGGPGDRSTLVFARGNRAPAVENTPRFRQRQNAGLEEALGVLDLPIRAALQEIKIGSVPIESEPAALCARPRNFVVGIADALEVEFPVFARLVGQVLRFTGDGVDLAPRLADLLDNSVFPIAP